MSDAPPVSARPERRLTRRLVIGVVILPVGISILPVRFGCRPEVAIHRVRF